MMDIFGGSGQQAPFWSRSMSSGLESKRLGAREERSVVRWARGHGGRDGGDGGMGGTTQHRQAGSCLWVGYFGINLDQKNVWLLCTSGDVRD